MWGCNGRDHAGRWGGQSECKVPTKQQQRKSQEIEKWFLYSKSSNLTKCRRIWLKENFDKVHQLVIGIPSYPQVFWGIFQLIPQVSPSWAPSPVSFSAGVADGHLPCCRSARPRRARFRATGRAAGSQGQESASGVGWWWRAFYICIHYKLYKYYTCLMSIYISIYIYIYL